MSCRAGAFSPANAVDTVTVAWNEPEPTIRAEVINEWENRIIKGDGFSSRLSFHYSPESEKSYVSFVIPAEAGIEFSRKFLLDSRFGECGD